MVRRWSRIVSFEFNTWADTPRSHLVSFRLFRKVTRFKRFNFGITKFRRRSWFRLKSRKNWIYFHFTLSKGLELYRLFRSLYKYQFYNSMLNLNSPSFISPWFKEHNFIFSELPNENYAWFLSKRLLGLTQARGAFKGGVYLESDQNQLKSGDFLTLVCPFQDSFNSYGKNWFLVFEELTELCHIYNMNQLIQVYNILILGLYSLTRDCL